MENKEFEVRFLEINVSEIVKKLKSLDAQDLGEELLNEVIFHNQDRNWQAEHKKLVRLRKSKNRTTIAYKDHATAGLEGVHEVEIEVTDFDKAKELLELVGLVPIRQQEKKRRTFRLGELTFDIDTWPGAPTYLEIEGPDESSIKKAAIELGLDWSKVIFEDAKTVLERYYKIPIATLKYFTFSKIE